MMYVDDVVLVSESKEVEQRPQEWRVVLKNRGMKILR